MVDTLDVAAVVNGRPAVFQLDIRRRTDLLQHVKDGIPLSEGNLRFGQDHRVFGNIGRFFLVQRPQITKNGVADDGDSADIPLLPRGDERIVRNRRNFVQASQIAVFPAPQVKRRQNAGHGDHGDQQNHHDIRKPLFLHPLFLPAKLFYSPVIVYRVDFPCSARLTATRA